MLLLSALSALALGRVIQQAKPFTEQEYWALWQEFLDMEGTGGYRTGTAHNERYDVFKSNMDFARDFNKNGTHSFTLGITTFADQTSDEFTAWLKTSSGTKPKKVTADQIYDASKYAAPPATMDWVEKGAVTPIKNQGQCGSCWAFSTTGGIEGQNFLKNNKLSSFSEQELVDCAQSFGNNGCEGGLMDDGFEFVKADGLCFESAYPYTGSDDSCKKSACTSQVTVKSHTDIAQGSTSDLLSAVGNVGPISIAVDANRMWQLYTGGIFNHYCNPSKLDHGVLLVGYGSDYWKVKNSWGASWGEKGYIRLTGTSTDTCGLANSASYPNL